jgi:hypothetical protein
MKARGGSVEQVVFSHPFPLIEAQNLNVPIIFISFGSISHDTQKTPKPLSGRIGENGILFTFSQNIFGKSLSLPHLRRDYFSMPSRANIRQPGKPEIEQHSIEAEGELYDDYSRKTQRSF